MCALRKIVTLLSLLGLSTAVLAQDDSGSDGYIGYHLEHRGDPESVIYETADTNPGVNALVPEPDVYLNASVFVGEIDIQVDNLTAKVNLDLQVLSLLTLNAGVSASIDQVKLLLQNVSARVELEARLENVVQMVDDVLSSIDLNPIIATLGQDVGNLVNTTVTGLTGDDGGSSSTLAARNEVGPEGYNIAHNVLYSVNNYQGQTHTNRVLAQNGSIYDVYLNNDGDETGRALVGYYARDMAFTGHNRTISVDGQVREYELQYAYRPFAGIDVISWIYINTAGQVTSTRIIAEAQGGGTSTVGDDTSPDL